GEFTDDSEGVLCIVESFTAASGEINPENILARLEILARGEGRRWMNPSTFEAIDQRETAGGAGHRVTGDVAARGIPLGLIAAGHPAEAAEAIDRWAPVLARMTHSAIIATDAIRLVAEAVRAASLGEIATADLPAALAQLQLDHDFSDRFAHLQTALHAGLPFEDIAAQIGFGDDVVSVLTTALAAVARAKTFEEGVFMAATPGGAADSRAAIAGAILGAAHGTAGIPQNLIDGLEGRMYIMLAAPWFFQTIQLRGSFWRSGTG
ncbi:MAG: ADP-ribosylglycohydrolase family protein, partial [Thermomicrobiales bacterium]